MVKAKKPESEELVAIKCLKRQGISDRQLKAIENEVIVLGKSNHPNIISLKDKLKSKMTYYLVLEFCNGGDLT